MKKCIVVSDTNIFIDLMSVDLLDAFFELPFDFRTTDFVINELTNNHQKEKIKTFIQSKKLIVKTFDSIELNAIIDLHHNIKTNASIQDCSVWYYSKLINAKLLTGDAKLRRVVTKDGLEVSGILFIFDLLIENEIVTSDKAIEKLILLLEKNIRLPFSECNKRIENWKSRKL